MMGNNIGLCVKEPMSLCRYKNLFGEPGKGVHSLRVFNFAAADIITTFVGSAIISRVTGYSFVVVLLALIILGVISHRVFCVKTTVDNFLFPAAFNPASVQ
jgi:hypothetical protein